LSVDLSSAFSEDCCVEQKSSLDIKKCFGKAIRRRRRELDLSQEELAESADLHRTYISSIERGERNVSLENIERLAEALDISISALFANYGIEAKE
jgi:transcriptional regulator with XRE-family HTH domain